MSAVISINKITVKYIAITKLKSRRGHRLVVRLRIGSQRAPGSKPCGVMRKVGKRLPAQASPSSSEHGAKLRGPSQKSHRVASKRDVNVNKLNSTKNT
ncbi:hypothetical protein AVEN_273966-1 [Araneus ventricosus]|uniref:Uncharacterized protein n=1 Tax=Araneus ventricosus TaxID=182803 RepID=A0A4Y2TCV8_ARAVE|nr:hypothetical protein AVEN_273966-1 [Araneus ventricosus]